MIRPTSEVDIHVKGCHGQRRVRYEWPSFTSIHTLYLYIYYVCEYYYCFCLANVPQALVKLSFETFIFVIIYLLMGPCLPCLSQC